MSENIPESTGFDWGEAGLPDPKEANEELISKHNEAVMKAARMVHAVMSQGRGPELMQYLRDRTIEIPLIKVSNTIGSGEIGLSTGEWAYFREGQNSVIRHLEEMIANAVSDLEQPKIES